MRKNTQACYYSDYLQLDKLLDAQAMESERHGNPAHDEMLFIVTHQAYELWFKQMLHELRSVMSLFEGETLDDSALATTVHRLKRFTAIQRLVNEQITVLETMSPQDFLEFRDYLVPASGFQSVQFKELEIRLGLRRDQRTEADRQFFYARLKDEDRQYLLDLEQQETLTCQLDRWLARLPLLEFDGFAFWEHYRKASQAMLDSDEAIIRNTFDGDDLKVQLEELDGTRARFAALFDEAHYKQMREEGQLSLSHRALMSALFINLYRDEPLFHLPFQLLTTLMEIDELFTAWRYRHVLMVQRMLGSKIGTGGSSGSDYLRRNTEANRLFKDLYAISTYLLPKHALPALPEAIKKKVGFSLG
ncbi:tryptophan 2,3-dioxygenase family protein [Gallaecimonas kandeliae]|uniref:tryptophan 2,3-dioxygenase family protein n=1 Tax=Gallaecimonas kandeliae TaxID=3029055 RepID=UPI002648BA36|nr:tryptophan 2,3-dioxygenase family protein [Gallaecimonas kandeliae]WKE64460.1 tryptophan 2,3-dioxygenase family protein [Gallaecimonas kandeliae]